MRRTESTKTWRRGQKPQRTSGQLSQTELLYSLGLHQLMILQIQTFKRILQRSTDGDTTSNTLHNYIFNLLIYQLLWSTLHSPTVIYQANLVFWLTPKTYCETFQVCPNNFTNTKNSLEKPSQPISFKPKMPICGPSDILPLNHNKI